MVRFKFGGGAISSPILYLYDIVHIFFIEMINDEKFSKGYISKSSKIAMHFLCKLSYTLFIRKKLSHFRSSQPCKERSIIYLIKLAMYLGPSSYTQSVQHSQENRQHC